MATGIQFVITDNTLRMTGHEKQTRKAYQLARTLVKTGEWVALTEGFVASQETTEKKRGDGPSEQILIKVVEGPVTLHIEKHLKAMERAAVADGLKITSKPVGGKRTLMCDGTKAAHERVKLMVKELMEKGESPMLTKELGVARAGRASKAAVMESPSEALWKQVVEKATNASNSKSVGIGVVAAAPQILSAKELADQYGDDAPTLSTDIAEAEAIAAQKAAEKSSVTGIGMRRMPAPKLLPTEPGVVGVLDDDDRPPSSSPRERRLMVAWSVRSRWR